jgi:alkylhydroperoxidase family enzyme
MPPRVRPPAVRGDDPVSASALAHQPELLAAFTRIYGTLWSHGVLDPVSKEMARLRNARLVDCRFCRNVRFASAREQGLSEDVVDEIRDGYEAGPLGAREKAILRWTDAFLRDPGGVSGELRDDMRRHFSAEQIVELTAGLALFMGFSKIAVSLGQVPKQMPVTVLPTPDH